MVIAVRGDYWDRCAAYPELVRAMQHDQIVVGPMTDADLRQVITGPAEASGLAVEPGLVEAILADLRSAADGDRGGPGALPLLSQALMLTWERRDGDQLTRRGYQDAGNQAGIARAIEVTAETAYRGLTEDQQAIAREVVPADDGPGSGPPAGPPGGDPPRAALRVAQERVARGRRGPGGVRPRPPAGAGRRPRRDRARRPAPGVAAAAGLAGRRRRPA